MIHQQRQSLTNNNMATNFENLSVRLYVLYVLNIYIKFCVNRILFNIQFINLFFTQNFILPKKKKKNHLNFKHLIVDIAINL